MGVVAELNVTNMVDLGFSLLIVFMITAPLLKQEQTIPLDLPVETARAQQRDRDEFRSVAVDRNGNYYWDNQRVNFQQIQLNLAALAGMPKPPVLRIRADASLQYQRVVALLDEVKKNNLSRISLDTQGDN
jgi:biopolymer transport protein ExbD